MSTTLLSAFEPLTERFELREPDAEKIRNADECRLMTDQDGLKHLTPAPVDGLAVGSPRHNSGEPEEFNTYLWVLCRDSIPCMLESAPIGKQLESGVVKHTNLTGGDKAYSGGELWLTDPASFYFSGGSGRYTPRSEEELKLIHEGFHSAGFNVICFGWDDDIAGPTRVLRSNEAWELHH